MKFEPTPKQSEYLDRIARGIGYRPEIDEKRSLADKDSWMLVSYSPPDNLISVQANLEHNSGEMIHILDEWVWIDKEGQEHFGPEESGYDRFKLNKMEI